MSARQIAALLGGVLFLTGLAGCGRNRGVARVDVGAPCAACGMPVRNLQFACVRGLDGRHRSFDAIECLLREGALRRGETAHLADYDTGGLHAADSVWVVRGEFPSPMGAGLAGFIDRAAADQIAAETHGRVARLWDFADEVSTAGPATSSGGGSPR